MTFARSARDEADDRSLFVAVFGEWSALATAEDPVDLPALPLSRARLFAHPRGPVRLRYPEPSRAIAG